MKYLYGLTFVHLLFIILVQLEEGLGLFLEDQKK